MFCCFVVEGAPQGLRLAWTDFWTLFLGIIVTLFLAGLDSGYCYVDVTGCFVDKPVVYKCKHPIAVKIHQFLCVDIVEDWGHGRALWKSHYQLLGHGDPVSKLHGDFSFPGVLPQAIF